MLSLNMVIIASMIGAGGLGFDVLAALRRLDIGAGLEAGLAIVVLADRARPAVSQAFARARRCAPSAERGRRRHALPLAALAAALALLAARRSSCRRSQTYPAALADLDRRRSGTRRSSWMNVNFFDTFEAFKTALLLNVLVPVKRLLLAQPCPGGGGRWSLALAGWQLGGPRLAPSIAAASPSSSPSPATGRRRWSRSISCGISVRVRRADRHADRHRLAALPQRRLAVVAGGHRHAADPAELRLPDPGGDAVPGRRFHRHDRRRRLCDRAGDPLHRARHPRRSTRR